MKKERLWNIVLAVALALSILKNVQQAIEYREFHQKSVELAAKLYELAKTSNETSETACHLSAAAEARGICSVIAGISKEMDTAAEDMKRGLQ